MNGKQPFSPNTALKKAIRLALFSHSVATGLESLGVDVEVAHALLRYSYSRTTMNIHT